jgi:asparagine synthase (glutamine-hydrolysing)
MCGLVGYIGSFSKESLEFAVQNLSHRGPDDSGTYVDNYNNIGLGHTRLSIQDLTLAGHQPMSNSDKSVTLVFNGEIYNFESLRDGLEKKGYSFNSDSDTEVLLNLYLEHGISAVKKLNGIFSFAIWDSNLAKVFLVRDALGVKPLYWIQTSKGIIFSSEIKAIRSFLIEKQEYDPVALHYHLSYIWCPGKRTALKNMFKVSPGEIMEISMDKSIRKWNWFSLPYTTESSIKAKKKEASYWINKTEEKLRQAVHNQMIADVPVGAFLSGGLDSSSIVAFARELNPDIRCFSIDLAGGQDEGTANDLPYARKVASHLNVNLDIIKVDSSKMANNLEKMIYQLDEPIADPASLHVMFISQLARDQGIKVLLSGAGGDDLFTGYRRHKAINYEFLWNWMPSSVLNNIEKTTLRLDQRKSYWRKLSKLFNGAGLKGDQAISKYFKWTSDHKLFQLYSSDFKEAIRSQGTNNPLDEYLNNLPNSLTNLEKMLLLEQRFFLTDHNLNYTDKMSMAVGVETRVPFLDLDLLDFASSIPIKYKQRGYEGKWILKKAMEQYLPKEVIYRPKTGFGAPLRRWMKNELSEIKQDLLSKESLSKRNIFDGDAIQKIIKEDANGKIDASYLLFSVLCIEIWCRKFLDRT